MYHVESVDSIRLSMDGPDTTTFDTLENTSLPIEFKYSRVQNLWLPPFFIYYKSLTQVKLGGHANVNIQKVGVLMPKFDQFPKQLNRFKQSHQQD